MTAAEAKAISDANTTYLLTEVFDMINAAALKGEYQISWTKERLNSETKNALKNAPNLFDVKDNWENESVIYIKWK